jgi:hypothetical protein
MFSVGAGASAALQAAGPRRMLARGGDAMATTIEGEALRRAVQWISDRKRDQPGLPLWRAIDEASVRFDLTPAEEQFLLQNWREVESSTAADR